MVDIFWCVMTQGARTFETSRGPNSYQNIWLFPIYAVFHVLPNLAIKYFTPFDAQKQNKNHMGCRSNLNKLQ